MVKTDDSGLLESQLLTFFFGLKSVYTASAFLVADFSKLHHILVSHVSVLSQTNKLFSSLISLWLYNVGDTLQILTPLKLQGLGIAGSLQGKPALSMEKGC